MRTPQRLLAVCLFLVTGCSMKMVPTQGTSATPTPTPATAHVLHGNLHGGQQPLYQASIYMYQISTGGYASASISMLQSATNTTRDSNGNYYVTTDQNGNFQITAADYTCTAGQQVYLYSLGGQPGTNSNTSSQNPNAGLMILLGDCSQFSTNLPATGLQMNEVSTVAAAYALAGYATDSTHIASGTSSSAVTGVANAFFTSKNLFDLGTGQARTTTPALNGTVPQAEINTLANILASCVHQTDSTDPNQNTSACSSLFLYSATPGCGFFCLPNDTATAAINIAHNPGANIAGLYGLMTASGPFQPVLNGGSGYAGPNDWTISIGYSGNGLSMTDGVAIDAAGGVWVSDSFAVSPANSGALSKFDNAGNPLYDLTTNGLNYPYGIAVDATNNAWVADNQSNAMSVFTSTGGTFSTSPFINDGLANPVGVAIDPTGNVWVTDGGSNSVSEFSSTGAGLSSSGFNVSDSGTYSGPTWVTSDNTGNIWISEQSNSIAEFVGGTGTPNFFTGGNLNNPVAIAADSSGNLWLANNPGGGGGSLSEFNNAGTPLSVANAYTGGGLANPAALAVDGNNMVWVANGGGNGGVSEFGNGGGADSPSTGYANTAGGANGIAIDSSGNIWLSGNVGGGLVEIVGAATPVFVPTSVAVANGNLGKRP